MTFPAMPDPAADREAARQPPEREVLVLATAGAAEVLTGADIPQRKTCGN